MDDAAAVYNVLILLSIMWGLLMAIILGLLMRLHVKDSRWFEDWRNSGRK